MMRMTALLLLAALALLAASATAAPAGREPFPPEVARQFGEDQFLLFQEPALWRPEARQSFRSRLRLMVVGIARRQGSIRIDERANGRLEGHLEIIELSDPASVRSRVERRFRVTRAQMESLRAAIDNAGLFRIHPQFWSLTDPDAICMDGMVMAFERVDAQGYRFGTANAWCDAPESLRQVARLMVDISGGHRLRFLVN